MNQPVISTHLNSVSLSLGTKPLSPGPEPPNLAGAYEPIQRIEEVFLGREGGLIAHDFAGQFPNICWLPPSPGCFNPDLYSFSPC